MPKCIILSGAPLSGKSTWAEKQKLSIISCDKLRLEKFDDKYVYDPKAEKEIWEDFYFRVGKFKEDFIVDNTNCKQGYINKIKSSLSDDVDGSLKLDNLSYLCGNPIVGILKDGYLQVNGYHLR
jgi:hypothetical protein